MHWSAHYLGLPWRENGAAHDGASCWGLVRLIYTEQLGIVLPTYCGEASEAERDELAAMLSAADQPDPTWRRIDRSDARAFDLIIFRFSGVGSHVGTLPWGRGEAETPRDRDAFLHVADGRTARIQHYADACWSPLVDGFLRHRSRM